jgi:hypothetical protein
MAFGVTAIGGTVWCFIDGPLSPRCLVVAGFFVAGGGKRRLADILLRQIRVAIVKGHKGRTQFATYE